MEAGSSSALGLRHAAAAGPVARHWRRRGAAKARDPGPGLELELKLRPGAAAPAANRTATKGQSLALSDWQINSKCYSDVW